ncbi:MAG: hypothetical protein WC785_03270 [Tatlockia sp.]|jgi:hypothetical protein
MKKILLAAIITACSAQALADSVIVTETNTWKSVPIVVDSTQHTYTVEGQGPLPEGDYYYTYSGYRCLTTKKDISGVDAITYNAGTPGGTDIYCYPEQ